MVEKHELYTYQVHYSIEDKEFVGTCLEFPSVSWVAEEPLETFNSIMGVIKDIVGDMRANGESLPAPINF